MTGEFQHRSLPMLLLQAREAALAVFRPILKEFSLTEQQWRIIRVLNDHATGEMEAGQIANECCILSPSLTGVLERMERDGLVRRVRPAQDQRKVMVSLSADCKALVKRISPLIEAQYCQIEQQIGIPRLNHLCHQLDELVAALTPADQLEHRPRGSEASFTVVRSGDKADNDALGSGGTGPMAFAGR
jgi:homoprotocatechuate degradation regulator HpaR